MVTDHCLSVAGGTREALSQRSSRLAFWRGLEAGLFRISCVVAVVALSGMPSQAGAPPTNSSQTEAWKKSPLTKDQLDPATRARFKALRSELESAKALYEKKLTAATEGNPLRLRATQISREASLQEALLKGLKADSDHFFSRLSDADRSAALAANAADQLTAECEVFRAVLNDSSIRPLAIAFCELFVANLKSGSLHSGGHSAAIQKLLATLSDVHSSDQAVEFYVKLIDQRRDDKLAQIGAAQAFRLPDEIKSYNRKAAERQTRFLIADAYVQHSNSADVAAAHENIVKINRQLDEVWPRWLWAETPPEVIREDESRTRGGRVELKKNTMILVVTNLAILLAVVLLCRKSKVIARHK